jgi:hypothetical protein
MKVAAPILILMIMCWISCRTTRVQRSIPGEYSSVGKDYEITLDLQRDSSFVFRKKNMEVLSESKGKWRYSFADTIFLIRDSAALPEKLSSGYIKDMPDKAFVKGKNAIQVGSSLLNRIK